MTLSNDVVAKAIKKAPSEQLLQELFERSNCGMLSVTMTVPRLDAVSLEKDNKLIPELLTRFIMQAGGILVQGGMVGLFETRAQDPIQNRSFVFTVPVVNKSVGWPRPCDAKNTKIPATDILGPNFGEHVQ